MIAGECVIVNAVTKSLKLGGTKMEHRNWRTVFSTFVGVCVLLSVQPVLALGIGVDRTPVPPECILNDGAGVEVYDWEIQFDSTPDHYLEILLDPDGELIYCVYHDLIGWGFPPAPPWDQCSYVDHSANWPQPSPVLGANSWTVPLGVKLGRYELRIQYYSLEVGEQWEAGGGGDFLRLPGHRLAAVSEVPRP